MEQALGILLVTMLFAAATLGTVAFPRVFSKWWLSRRMYQHVDDVSGAKRWEAEYAKTMRNTWGENSLTRWLWPHPDLSGVMARPHWWRRRIYVELGFASKPWPHPYFKRDVEQTTITYTSEADVNNPHIHFWLRLEYKVAQALSRAWNEDLFVHDAKEFPFTGGLTDHRPERDQVTLIVATPLRLGARVSGAELLNGRANGQVEQVDTNRGQPVDL